MKYNIKEIFGKKWKYIETKNFIRYIRPLNRKISKKDLESAEKHLKKFCKIFGIKKLKKIIVYSVKDRKEMKEFFGYETNGKVKIKDWIVFSVYISQPHEIVHILADNNLGEPNNLLGEGIAVAYGWKEGWHKKSLEYWIKKFVDEGKIIPLRLLMDDLKFKIELDDDITYPESGAFVRFLINKFGLQKFKKLYSKIGWKRPVKETIKIFENVLKVKFDKLEEQFIEYYTKKRLK